MVLNKTEYMKEYNKKYRKLHQKGYKEYAKNYYKSHQEEIKQRVKNRLKSPEGKKLRAEYEKSPRVKNYRHSWAKTPSGKKSSRKTYLKLHYGLTFSQRNKMVREQHGRCYICKKPEIVKQYGKIKRLAVDEDPKTKKVRHLLCQNCNLFVNLIEKRRAALKYYQRYLKEPPSGIKYNHNLRGGISSKLRTKMLKEQRGVCYICKKGQNSKYRGKIKSLEADHNHKTDMVRHLLCQKCNLLVDYMEKKTVSLKNYKKYIKDNRIA